MQLLRFDAREGPPIYINLDKIIAVSERNKDETYIVVQYLPDGDVLTVQGHIDNVVKKIKEECRGWRQE